MPAGFLLQGPPHKCALFFVDNSGIDIILGVFPFIRELLIRGTEVSQQQYLRRKLLLLALLNVFFEFYLHM